MLLRVAAKSEIADGVFLFDLRDTSGGDLPPFTPGAHIAISLPNGQKRQYSLCNVPEERDRYFIAVKCERDGRGGSFSLINDVREGDTLPVEGPGNDFEMSRQMPKTYLFIAGGIGITPIRSMIHSIVAQGKTNFRLFYFTRNAAATAFRDDFAGPQYARKVVIHHDEGDPARAYDLWPILGEQKGAHLYCCGPRQLMSAVRDMTGHWSEDALHFEDFGGATAPKADDTPFTVRLAKDACTLVVPVGVSILDTLRSAGHHLPSSCESGTCGTCKTRYLAGEPDHRDLVLSESEKKESVMVCVSRSHSPELVLDI